MKKPSDVTHIDDNGVRYSYLGENNYAVWMDKEKHPYWRPMPHNTIECASSIRSVSDIDRIAELEKERDKLKAHTVALELDFDSALDIAELCANNPSVVDANKSFQEFVSYTNIESTLEAHNLEHTRKGFWLGFESARCHGDEMNILMMWEQTKAFNDSKATKDPS